MQRDCIKIQFTQVCAPERWAQSIRICFVGRYSSEHQQAENLPWKNKYCFCVLLPHCLQRQSEQWVGLCSSFFVCPSLGICSSLTEHTTLQQSPPRTSHLSGGTCPPGPGTQRSSPGEDQVRGQLARSEPSLISPHEMFGRQCQARLLSTSRLGSSTTNFLFTAQTNSP